MDHDRHNAILSDAAHWRMRWDGGLRWACGPKTLGARCFLDDGALILRRWTGKKYPRPEFPAAVGFALRPATTVDEDDSAGHAADTVYWYAVDKVSGGGVITRCLGPDIEPGLFDSGASYVGLVPNPPGLLQARQTPTGDLALAWHYNPTGQQVAPAQFNIYTDSGSGTFSDTPHATVAYTPGREWYSWLNEAGGWNGWLWLVLAATSGGVVSLVPLTYGRGTAVQQGADGPAAAEIGVRSSLLSAAPADVPDFGFS